MAHYLLSAHSAQGETREPMTDEQMRHSYQAITALEREMRAADALRFSGRLHDPETATVVRPSNGKVMTTDGPFVESKEQLGGFYIIEAPDLDGALSWASKTALAVNTPIEVRPFLDVAGG